MQTAGKKYLVEAFLEFDVMKPTYESIVKVKWEQHDVPTWEPVSAMREQLGNTSFSHFAKDVPGTSK